MSSFEDYYAARKEIVKIVKSDLVGPVYHDEVINEPPTSYYIMGKLYPKVSVKTEQDDPTISVDLEATEGEVTLAATNAKDPGAMGVTFTVKQGVNNIKITVKYAQYYPFTFAAAKEQGIDISRYSELIEMADEREKGRLLFWKREEYEKELVVSTNGYSATELSEGLFIKVFLHMITDEEERVMTAVLTNEASAIDTDRNSIAAKTIMQPVIRVSACENQPIFTEVRRQVDLTESNELLGMEMLYSADRCFAQGHGCSVVWDTENEDPLYIQTDFMPTHNLRQMKASSIEGNPAFNMHYLYTANRDEVILNLRDFIKLYGDWIENRRRDSNKDEYAAYADYAAENLNACDAIRKRISHSVDLLEADKPDNNNAWIAFRYANEAMYMQRCRTIAKDAKEKGTEAIINPEEINWYPFQLAFILLEIASFVEPEGYDRRLVDLLWFPTGGGKTEAYLGISAFEIFYRRLASPANCNGIAVIMRYTLRLLTIQQFERASMLICACELLRKKYAIPGGEITIGLWVGNDFTPGKLDEADSVLAKIKATGQHSKEDTNPCQVKVCPWCGNKLYARHYEVSSTEARMRIVCDNQGCDYCGTALPVRLIDEEIYTHRPAFLVATVDKFAQITIQDKVAALFSADSDDLPPELIIQDELHLISGPLGTMTGIYEAAITNVCENLGRAVKIIASTATIRNASNQILALYGRKHNQFPPQGLSYKDSFFAELASPDERPARLYCGVMGVGTTFTTTIIRLYAAWLFASRYLVDLGYSEKVIDNYWTLTGYFNSIRELGATQTQIVDDIQSRYKYLRENKFKTKYPEFSGKPTYDYSRELTSRMSNEEITEIIQIGLKKPYRKEDSSEVYDFILASNMISVGVDVGRLGTMVVAGQSKTNAEYIQATSRVGRSNPGLVFAVYNAVRSRDRSHYEQFSRYHSALYRYVEATSLTPFSERARDRGLQALFVTLCRYFCPELLPDNSAGAFSPDLEGVKKAERVIYSYVNVVDPRESDKVLAEIKEIEREWTEKTACGELWYRKKGKPSLLQPDTDEDNRFRTMNSMRSVEPESGVYLVGESE